MIHSDSKTTYEALHRHPVHPFPARMAPGLACNIISQEPTPIRILDPMMGSGTVLALARSKGHYAIGVDIDPLAVLISRVWTRTIDPDQTRSAARAVLGRARDAFKALVSQDAYPRGSDQESQKFIRYWFDPYARKQLTALSTAIGRVRNEIVRDVLWCAFSRLIIAKQSGASLAMDLAHSRPHKAFSRAPIEPFEKFLAAVNRVVDNCLTKKTKPRGPVPVICEGDARKLILESNSIHLVLTSPPYLNAIDYIRCSKFSLVWMGYNISQLRSLRSHSIGAEVGYACKSGESDVEQIIVDLGLQPKLEKRQEALLARYVHDMKGAIDEIVRVLAPNGKAVYVIGENTIRGTFIPNSEIITAVALRAGLQLCEQHARALPANRRYLPPPSGGKDADKLDNRMRREVVLTFTKQKH